MSYVSFFVGEEDLENASQKGLIFPFERRLRLTYRVPSFFA